MRHRSSLDEDKAVEQPDGTYSMNGTKIFISGGDQDLTDNIIHMVIAKIPDENGQIHDDLSTVNFFMVPNSSSRKTGPWPRATASIPAASNTRWASRVRPPAC
jgi:alkylation response protein AidB-like acyl-CoA dehydrogenase